MDTWSGAGRESHNTCTTPHVSHVTMTRAARARIRTSNLKMAQPHLAGPLVILLFIQFITGLIFWIYFIFYWLARVAK